MLRILISAAVFSLATSAWAQSPPINDAAKAMVGAWELSNATRDRICSVTFSQSAVKVGYRIVFAPECAALFPLVPTIAGWRYPDDDLLYWLDARGNALVQFSEVEDGIFEAPTPGIGVLFLHNPALVDPQVNENPEGGDSTPGGQPATPQQDPAPQPGGG